MTPAGHVAFAWLAADARTSDRTLPLVAAAGALLPDLLDKSLKFAGVYPWGRTIGHSVVVWLLLAGFVVLTATTVRPARWAPWLVFGGFSHLVADLVNDVVAAFQWHEYVFAAWWGWPITNPDMWAVKVHPLYYASFEMTYFEVAVVLLLVIRLVRQRRDRDAPSPHVMPRP